MRQTTPRLLELHAATAFHFLGSGTDGLRGAGNLMLASAAVRCWRVRRCFEGGGGGRLAPPRTRRGQPLLGGKTSSTQVIPNRSVTIPYRGE